MKNWREILEEFKRPFNSKDIEWRVQRCGKSGNGKVWAMVLAFVDARALRRRLNEIVGPENWSTRFYEVGDGVACALSVRGIGEDGKLEWVEKSDGAGKTDIEAVKGAFSDAFKRACYSWGLGEYLYDLETTFAEVVLHKEDARYHTYDKKLNEEVHWNPPALPDWALPPDESVKKEKAATGKKSNEPKIVALATKYATFLTEETKRWASETDFSAKTPEWLERNVRKLMDNIALALKRKIEDLMLDECLKSGEARGMITVLGDNDNLTESRLDAALKLYEEGMARMAEKDASRASA